MYLNPDDIDARLPGATTNSVYEKTSFQQTVEYLFLVTYHLQATQTQSSNLARRKKKRVNKTDIF